MSCAAMGLLVLSPLLILLCIAVKCTSTGPIFFSQPRVGKRGRVFPILKFRGMYVNNPKDAIQITAGRDPRITPLGHYLRKSKCDELPQLINVLLGQMSLVGPRPETPEHVAYYSKRDQEIVLSVRPGITDLASIRFRAENEILARSDDPKRTYINSVLPRKLALRRIYVANQSLCFDVWLILKTL